MIAFHDKPYFNKTTQEINIVSGVEGGEGVEPISDKKYVYIQVIYHIANYFGDKSGKHVRAKNYVYDGEQYYKDGERVKRLPKEVRMAVEEYNER